MVEESAVLVLEARDFDSCMDKVRQFLRQNPSATMIKVALSTPDFKPLGARVWRLLDQNIDAISHIIVGFIMTQPDGSVTISAQAG